MADRDPKKFDPAHAASLDAAEREDYLPSEKLVALLELDGSDLRHNSTGVRLTIWRARAMLRTQIHNCVDCLAGQGANMPPKDQPPSRWPLERGLFALTGTITLLSVALGAFVSRWFLLAAALVGVGQWLYVKVGDCPGAMLLRRGCRLRSAIYHNETAPAEKPVVRAAA